MNLRNETDFLGTKELPEDALYGIQSLRALENFPSFVPFKTEWYKAMGTVKLACYLTYKKYLSALRNINAGKGSAVNIISDEKIDALITSAGEMAEGKWQEHFIVPAVSGGAGTSINMNINEILANVALLKLGHKPGEYEIVDPVETANVFQSTNDVVPTALKVAVMRLLQELEIAINACRAVMENIEINSQHDLRIGYTQLQEAVPSSFGKLFSAYNEALSRDWWRVSKCFERIKLVNLGGGAIGTGLGSPRFFIMEVVSQLQTLTHLPLARSENMPDATSNLDSFVEIHGILKAHAVNLEKIVSDLRLLGSDIMGGSQLSLPQKQMGSTIMPGKVNPVISEYIISVAHKVYANDMLIASLCGQGMLELNAYLPVIGDALLDSLLLLISACSTLKENMLTGLKWNKEVSIDRLYSSPAITTALSPYIGYHKAGEMARKMKEEKIDVFECNESLHYMDDDLIHEALKADKLLKMGYTLDDIKGEEKKNV